MPWRAGALPMPWAGAELLESWAEGYCGEGRGRGRGGPRGLHRRAVWARRRPDRPTGSAAPCSAALLVSPALAARTMFQAESAMALCVGPCVCLLFYKLVDVILQILTKQTEVRPIEAGRVGLFALPRSSRLAQTVLAGVRRPSRAANGRSGSSGMASATGRGCPGIPRGFARGARCDAGPEHPSPLACRRVEAADESIA